MHLFIVAKFIVVGIFITLTLTTPNKTNAQDINKGNVIFIHPDGTSLATWNATRILYYGTDGTLN